MLDLEVVGSGGLTELTAIKNIAHNIEIISSIKKKGTLFFNQNFLKPFDSSIVSFGVGWTKEKYEYIHETIKITIKIEPKI